MSMSMNNIEGEIAPFTLLFICALEIQDIQGIGPTTAKKLKEADIVSVMDLVVTSADELAVDINASKESAAAFIMAAQKLLRDSRIIEKEFLTADLAVEKRKSMLSCSGFRTHERGERDSG
jgi:DNA repair protein RadA